MRFDTILHLSCDHVLPVYRAAAQVTAPRHIVAVAQEQGQTYQLLQGAINGKLGTVEKVNVQTSEPAEYVGRILKVLNGLPEGRHAIHLHGAPRAVYTDMLLYCREHNLPGFFMDPSEPAFRWVTGDEEREPLKGSQPSVKEYFQMAGYAVDTERADAAFEQSGQTRKAALAAWEHHEQLRTFGKEVYTFARKPGQPFRVGRMDIDGVHISASLKRPKDGSKGVLQLGGQEFKVRPWANLASFICGGWYREAILANLLQAKAQQGILDIMTECYVECEAPQPGMPGRYHIDIAYTVPQGLVLMQTFLKPPEPHHLRNLRDFTCGVGHTFGRGVLCSPQKPENQPIQPKLWPEVDLLLGPESIFQPWARK